ncbi:MAG TPA: ATP-binding protein [Gemmatimonadaceae bacterium]|nr:ATP-binding protein [Gemmatimonadaceae bacterium]
MSQPTTGALATTQTAAHSRWRSIEWTLPLLICVLLLLVMAVFATITYEAVRMASLRAAESRTEAVAQQLASLLDASMQHSLADARQHAMAPSLVAFLRSPNDASKAAAMAELTRLSARSPQSLGVELRDAAGRRVLGTTGFSPNGALLVPSAGRDAEMSTLRWTGTSVWIDVAARVHAGPTDTLGTLVQYSTLGTAKSQKALEELIGPTAVFLLGNQDNSMWTNIERPVAGPSFDPRSRTSLIRDTVGGGRIGAVMRMREAPWVVWVGLPMASVLAPVHTLLGKLIVTAAIILLIGAGVAWVASRRVTKPLGELTQASEGIAAGDYSRRVPALHDNELGRLAASFNSMAAQVEDGRRDLEQRVAERTTELRGALERLSLAQQEVVRSEKLAFLGQLAGGVGHELRNPLGVMTNAVHYLGLVLQNAPATVVEYLGILRTQIGLAERIVGDLLDSARVKAPQREAVAARDLFSDQLKRIAIHPGITVDVDVPADIPPLYVDRIQLGQVLLNLISNGTQAIGESKGTLTLRARANGDRMATMEVQDTGGGIGPEDLPHIFEPLFTTKARGLGLGLSVARSLVVVNGGELTVESEKGRGSTFTVRVPIVGAHA